MEIIVEGRGINFFEPNQVIFNFTFISKSENYDEVLELGSKNVKNFIDKILTKNKIASNKMKTRNFVIREETKFNELTRKYEFDGYSYNQNAELRFDYNKNKMAKIMDEISKLDIPPIYQISFGIKDEQECRREILKDAYNDALEQAKVIADAAGKNLIQCVKTDFKPFTTEYSSSTKIGSDMLYAKKTYICSAENIANTFTPEDIEIMESLYCLWQAE